MKKRTNTQYEKPKTTKKEFHELQAFACCVKTDNGEHKKPSSRERLRGKFKDGLCLKFWFESDGYFCNIIELDSF